MRLTQVLFQQHIGRQIIRHWYVQSKQRPYELNSHKELEKLGIPIIDPQSIIELPKIKNWDPFTNTEYVPKPKKAPKQTEVYYSYTDESLFIQGLPQAELLLKTVKVDDKLPDKYEQIVENLPENITNQAERIVGSSTVFDSHQEKLPKKKHPEKLMWVYSRDYGITPIRKTNNLCRKMLELCERMSNEISSGRMVVYDGVTSFPFEKESDKLQFRMTMNIMLTSSSPLSNICEKEAYSDRELPDIHPSHPVIGIGQSKWEKLADLYPINSTFAKNHPHTIFAYYDLATMKNITERPIKEDQILARSMAKSFTAAASYARLRFGSDVKDLPEPVTIQCIQCDGQKFHFSVYQLNTLNLDGTDGLKNYWWSQPRMDLYEKACYEEGRPVIEGFNPEVLRKMLAFYKNS